MIRHQIGLLRVAGGIRNKIWEVLDATESDIRKEIRERMRQAVGFETPAQVVRLERLEQEIEAIRNVGWAQANAIWQAELAALAVAEPAILAGIFQTVVPFTLEPVIPDARRMKAIVSTKPFMGRVMKDWAKDIQVKDITRIHDQIKIGLVRGESIPEISRRVVGSVAMKGKDGVTQITRRNAETLTRTAASHVAAVATQEFTKENSDIIDVELFLATLDSRTTPICRSLDGDTFKLDSPEKPVLPIHWGERSRLIGMIDPEPLGERPMKPTTERQLLREFAAAEKLDKVPKKRADLPRGTKGSFDDFARKRTREMIGRVPAKTTYHDFLTRQSASIQDDILGKTRGKLFRDGGMSLKKFVDRDGSEIPLSELAKTEKAAFKKAGLDPEDFFD